MRNSAAYRIYCCLQRRGARKFCSSSSTGFPRIHECGPPSKRNFLGGFKSSCVSPEPAPCFASTAARRGFHAHDGPSRRYLVGETSSSSSEDDTEEVDPDDLWEDEDDAEPEIGDGSLGGGVALNECPWGEKALSLAQDVLRGFGEELQLFAFKANPRGYIYVRLDNTSKEYGCPDLEEMESFHRQFLIKLEEEIPESLGIQVSSPGANRLLRVPDDLLRFKDKAMVVNYLEVSGARSEEKDKVYLLDSIETEEQCCVWKLADVKENRDPAVKGKPMNRKQKDARVKLPYDMIKRVTFYISR